MDTIIVGNPRYYRGRSVVTVIAANGFPTHAALHRNFIVARGLFFVK